jgi:hypothetical protein
VIRIVPATPDCTVSARKGHRRLDRGDRTQHRDVTIVTECLDIDAGDRFGRDADRIEDQHCDRAELRRAGGHGRDQGRPVGHVDLPDVDPGPRPGQFRNDCLHRRPAPVQQKQVEPASGEPPGQRRPEAGSHADDRRCAHLTTTRTRSSVHPEPACPSR